MSRLMCAIALPALSKILGSQWIEFESRTILYRILADSRKLTSDIEAMAQQRKKKQQKISDVLSEIKDAATKPSTSYDPTLTSLFATSVSMAPQSDA